MIFKNATTSEKLNFLAELIEGKLKKTFNQWNGTTCAVALGVRVYGSGKLRPASFISNTSSSTDKRNFAEKFGVTVEEAGYLYIADYNDINGRLRSGKYGEVKANHAANALRVLARKYAKRGN